MTAMLKSLSLALVVIALPMGSGAQTPPPPAPPAPSGETVYANNCAACHQPMGQGIAGPFPALAANKLVTGPAEPLTVTVLVGRGGMPAFKNELNDADMAALLTYIRGAWGNQAGPVSAADMAATRTKVAADAQPKDLQAH
jgi:mono/diheme cytochrome c family protein